MLYTRDPIDANLRRPVGLRDTRAGLLVQAAGSRLPERGAVARRQGDGVRRNCGEEPGAVDGLRGRPGVGAARAAWRRGRAGGVVPAVDGPCGGPASGGVNGRAAVGRTAAACTGTGTTGRRNGG